MIFQLGDVTTVLYGTSSLFRGTHLVFRGVRNAPSGSGAIRRLCLVEAGRTHGAWFAFERWLLLKAECQVWLQAFQSRQSTSESRKLSLGIRRLHLGDTRQTPLCVQFQRVPPGPFASAHTLSNHSAYTGNNAYAALVPTDFPGQHPYELTG